ncbi:hypothetical protein ACWDBF_21255 [Streptomyces angustmyceticus]
MTDDLRQSIAAALAREDAHNCGYDHGFVDKYGIDPETDGIIDAVLNAVQPELDELQENACVLRALRRHRDTAEAEVKRLTERADRVRSLHPYNEDAGYCDLCSNHGDITWPCATVKALDGPDETAEEA